MGGCWLVDRQGRVPVSQLRLGRTVHCTGADPGGVPTGMLVTTSSHKADFQTIRIGFNYLFNAAPAAVPVYGK